MNTLFSFRWNTQRTAKSPRIMKNDPSFANVIFVASVQPSFAQNEPILQQRPKKTNSCTFASSFLTMESINQPENGWQKMSEQFFIMIELDRDSLIVFSSFIWWKQYTCTVYIHNMYIILFNSIQFISFGCDIYLSYHALFNTDFYWYRIFDIICCVEWREREKNTEQMKWNEAEIFSGFMQFLDQLACSSLSHPIY